MDKSITDYFSQQHKREEQLYSEVLKCFERHKENTLKDLKVFQHNYKLNKKRVVVGNTFIKKQNEVNKK
tara:strand:+ start:157 stop:363 length:207 start_codon:yes stop_codon:yes gene_type:complete